MEGGGLPPRTLFFSHQQARAVIQGSWKIVWGKRTLEPLRWELYNLAENRCEVRDLAERYPDRVAAMAAEWESYRQRVGLEEFEPWRVPEIEGISD
jgi:arylsulfatase A-like enzyme